MKTVFKMRIARPATIFSFLLIILLVSGSFSPPAANFQISKNGKAAVNIVIADNAGKEVVLAATELRDYIKKISGAALKIIKEKASTGKNIYVGKSKAVDALKVSAEDLGKEGFTIQTVKGNLILLGHDDAGTQFAVYTFLENYLGVRWLWPGKFGEVVLVNKNISISEIKDTQQPHYKWRSRMSMNENDVWRNKITSDTMVQEVELWEKRNKWGGMKIYGGHSLSEIFPPEKYAKSHPEYYALANGVRDAPGPNYDFKHGSQVCTTNPDVIRIACEWANKFFDDHPDYDAVNMSMNDGGGLGYCQCENCTALDDGRKIEAPLDSDESISKDPSKNVIITDRIFTYINKIAESVQKKHPGKYIMCFAYSQYKRPPKNIVLNPMVIPQYTQWSAYSHANAKIKAQHERIAKGWGAAANRMAIYEYYINGSWPSMHRVTPGLFADNIKELYKDGVNLYYTQAGTEFAVNGLNYYVAGKLLWNTSLAEQKILDDYYEKGFGKAAKYIQRFNTKMEDAWKAATKYGKDVTAGTLADTRILELFTPVLLASCAEDLKKAAAIAENEQVKKRIAFIQNGFQYTLLTVKATQKAKDLLAMGVPLFTKEKAKQEVELSTDQTPEAKKIKQDQHTLILEALKAWEERDAFVEAHKGDHVLSYFWIKYNDANRYFNPHQKLKALAYAIN
ncbi:MAG TPA: DUF4838 domain-containing protein [Chitinophagaceae bacterium]|nr:DUF4838 domain-containing protein [Chitinophagaceae bacterium]